MKKIVIAAALVGSLVATGCASQRDHEALVARTAQVEKDAAQANANLVALRVDLEATRARLDNALRANADSSGDFIAIEAAPQRARRPVDEVTHGIDELRRDVGASRTELYARLDELKRRSASASAAARADRGAGR